MNFKKSSGFTLIELIMVVVILGILAAMVIPRFVDLQGKAKENTAQAVLGAVRAAVAVKYASNVVWTTVTTPTTIEASMFQDNEVPKEVISGVTTVSYQAAAPTASTTSGWAYSTASGKVWVNDSRYTAW